MHVPLRLKSKLTLGHENVASKKWTRIYRKAGFRSTKKKKNQSLKIFGVMDDVKCKGNL